MGALEEWRNTLILFPEWYGGDLVPSTVSISPGLRSRLREWNRVWETVLDPVTEIRWPDPEIGRRWIAEGDELVRQLQRELGPEVRVIGDFEGYSPDFLPGGKPSEG